MLFPLTELELEPLSFLRDIGISLHMAVGREEVLTSVSFLSLSTLKDLDEVEGTAELSFSGTLVDETSGFSALVGVLRVCSSTRDSE